MCDWRKDGGLKRGGLRQGDRRLARTLRFKLQVVDEYRWLRRRKAEGRCDAPMREAAARFGVHKSLVSKWAAQEAALRRAVACDGEAASRSRSTPPVASPQASAPPAASAPSASTDAELPVPPQRPERASAAPSPLLSTPSPQPSPPVRLRRPPSYPSGPPGSLGLSSARRAATERLSRHPCSECHFPHAEAEAHQVYRRRRARGLRVTARTLRVCMRRAIRKHHGATAASAFRASDRWL